MYLDLLRDTILDVLKVLLPLLIILALAQWLFLKLPRDYLTNIIKGLALAFAGMVLFLYGVHLGFLPLGSIMGEMLGSIEHKWMLMPFGLIMGFMASFSEPAVRVLSKQVEESSGGYINSRVVLYSISLGVAFFVALAFVKIVYGIPLLYILLPGYLVALIMMWFCDSSFVAIAFDAGGVATGPMAVTFLMAVAVGAATMIEGRNPIIDGFGLIALIALAPIISLLFIGIVYRNVYKVSSEEVKEYDTGDS